MSNKSKAEAEAMDVSMWFISIHPQQALSSTKDLTSFYHQVKLLGDHKEESKEQQQPPTKPLEDLAGLIRFSSQT